MCVLCFSLYYKVDIVRHNTLKISHKENGQTSAYCYLVQSGLVITSLTYGHMGDAAVILKVLF